jgi:phage protein D
MAHECFIVETKDDSGKSTTLEIPRDEFVGLEVELDTELASMFRLHLAIGQQRDGTWTYVDDERFRLWKPMTIKMGFAEGMEDLISGYITHVRPDFDPDLSRCTLEIWGMDSTVRMDREEKLHAWPNEKDSSIAAQIFDLYGFSSVVDDTRVVHDEAVSTIIQRETDIQFLKRLALRNGFECYVEGSTGFFRKPQVNAPPQPVLAVHFGEETTVNRLTFEVNALTPARVTMAQVDRASKEVLEATATATQQPALGAIGSAPPAGIPLGQVYVGMTAATGLPEMIALCQGLVDEGEWFVTAEGEIAGNQYGHVLKPRGTVIIKGVGATYSGVYYVTHVTHALTPQGYTQFFRAKRNALMPTGSEDFAGSSARLGNVFLGALLGGASR